MKRTLTLLPLSRSRIGPIVGTGPITQYEVSGLLPGQEASIANFGTEDQHSWRIFRVKDGIDTGWIGDHKTAEDALAILQKEID